MHFVGFGDTSLDIQIKCRILNSNHDQFVGICEDVLQRIIELVADAGTVRTTQSLFYT